MQGRCSNPIDTTHVFVNSRTMDGYLGRELRDKIENPVIFQPPGAAAASPVSSRANGYDATILIDIWPSFALPIAS